MMTKNPRDTIVHIDSEKLKMKMIEIKYLTIVVS